MNEIIGIIWLVPSDEKGVFAEVYHYKFYSSSSDFRVYLEVD